MNISQLAKLGQKAIKKLDNGDLKGALKLAYKIRSLGSVPIVPYMVSALLIDIGGAMENEEVVKEGVDMLQKDFQAVVDYDAPRAHYNLANGYYALFRFKLMKDRYIGCFEKTELDQARFHYRRALEYDVQDIALKSEAWVNLGNCFDTVGRVMDALECYEEALELKPDHGMALGNKGLALSYYAALAGEHQSTFLIEAYSFLSKALQLGVPRETVPTFSKYIKDIVKQFPDKQILNKPPEYPGYTIKTSSEFDRFLQEFCLTNRLYLNICNFCQRCDAAIGDTAVIRKMIVPVNKDSYFRFSAYLNQIKQDYVTARFLLVLSKYEGLDLDFVDKYVRIINTLDYSLHNIYIQLLKTSFKVFYDILDKIACFVDDYLELGISPTDIKFHTIWYSDRKTKKVRKKIKDTRSHCLNALFDIHKEFEKDGPYEKLRNTRNALTHRFVNIRMFQEDEEDMTEDTFIEQTLELARIVRNAIIYLLQFVNIEENRKEAKTEGILLPRLAVELSDRFKTER